MTPERPINADVPAPEKPEEATPENAGATEAEAPPATAKAPARQPQEAKPASAPRAPNPDGKPLRRRLPSVSPPLLALGGIVALAVVFIVAAVVFGSGGGQSDSTEAPAPAPAAATGGSEAAEELGFPAFATSNTTRVGGADPASNAAGVALAVFPSTTPQQRPAAVTLVDERDWAAAIAAAVLAGPPVRAPILFSGPGDLPDVTAEALERLQPQGGPETAGAAYFAIGDVTRPDVKASAARVDSGDPASTAAQIATLRDQLFGGPADAVVIAPSSRPDIAMPAAAWAARSGDPVLYSDPAKLPQPTAAALKRNPKAKVYVLGPAAAISSDVIGEISKIDKRVERVAGDDAVSNALAFARFSDGGFGWDINDPGHGFVLARSDSPLDAAAAAPLSASGTWGPLLLTDDAATLPAELRSYFLDLKPGYTDDPTRAFYNHVWVIGDQEAIDVNQQAEVNELAELTKIGGGE
ncbi:MAG TPA: cell wall-binding repeat-containing protein [Solirubrobacterales bacterium]|nr:cell wall-binding repeat-containing protein [Solirubrobacterales bacterium]